MSILDYFRTKKATITPIDILKEGANQRLKTNCNCDLNGRTLEQNPDAIRIIFVALEKFIRYGTGTAMLGTTLNISSPYMLPQGMTLEEACKVFSYLSEQVEKSYNMETSNNSVALTCHRLEDFGFKKIETDKSCKSDYNHGYIHETADYTKGKHLFNNAISGVTDLMTVGGDWKEFENTDLYDRYFNWFTPGVTRKEIRDIYERLDILVPELVDEDDQLRIEGM